MEISNLDSSLPVMSFTELHNVLLSFLDLVRFFQIVLGCSCSYLVDSRIDSSIQSFLTSFLALVRSNSDLNQQLLSLND